MAAAVAVAEVAAGGAAADEAAVADAAGVSAVGAEVGAAVEVMLGAGPCRGRPAATLVACPPPRCPSPRRLVEPDRADRTLSAAPAARPSNAVVGGEDKVNRKPNYCHCDRKPNYCHCKVQAWHELQCAMLNEFFANDITARSENVTTTSSSAVQDTSGRLDETHHCLEPRCEHSDAHL